MVELTNVQLMQLVQGAKNGDTAKYEILAKQYRNLINATARKYFVTNANTDDLVQEAMIGLHNAIIDYKEASGNFSAFAKMCVERRVLATVTKFNRGKHKPPNGTVSIDDETVSDMLVSGTLDPLEAIIKKERLNLISQAINNLSAFEKNVYKMYLDGYSYEEISCISAKPLKAIDNALARAKRKVLKSVQE